MLQFGVDGEFDGATGSRGSTVEDANRASASGGFNALDARFTVQFFFVKLLDAQFADVVGAAVVGALLIGPRFNLLLLALIDASDITHQVAGGCPQGVVAEKTGADFNTGEAPALGGKPGHLFVGKQCANRNGLKRFGLAEEFIEATSIALADRDERLEFAQYRIEVRYF